MVGINLIGLFSPSLALLLLLLARNDVVLGAENWGYTGRHGNHGVDDWCKRVEEQCCGARQSPIDIASEKVVRAEFSPFTFHDYDKSGSLVAENNGHTIVYRFKDGGPRPRISEGGLLGTYVFDSLHWHFGSKNSRGSEHTFDNRSFPLEMHLVHYNQKYKGVGDALKNPDGLAVLGVVYHVTGSSSVAHLDVVSKAASKCTHPHNKVGLDKHVSLESLLPDDVDDFYRYDGSLTTPGCAEVVTWTVFETRVPISDKQLQMFRTLKAGHDADSEEDMADNYRPPQKLNARTVFKRVGSDAPTTKCSNTVLVLFFVLASALSGKYYTTTTSY